MFSFLLIWWAVGAIGAYLQVLSIQWVDGHDRWSVHRPINFCPTPRELLIVFALGFTGPFVLLMSAVSWVIIALTIVSGKGWWTMPICQIWKKDD
jgi:hypothetical protein